MPLRYTRRILDHLAHATYRPATAVDTARDLRVDREDQALFEEASRLRARWRLATQDPGAGAEAQALLETLLVRRWSAWDALLHARAAIAAESAKAWMPASERALTVIPPADVSTVESAIVARTLPPISLTARVTATETPTETDPLPVTEIAADRFFARIAELSCATTSTSPAASTLLSTIDAS